MRDFYFFVRTSELFSSQNPRHFDRYSIVLDQFTLSVCRSISGKSNCSHRLSSEYHFAVWHCDQPRPLKSLYSFRGHQCQCYSSWFLYYSVDDRCLDFWHVLYMYLHKEKCVNSMRIIHTMSIPTIMHIINTQTMKMIWPQMFACSMEMDAKCMKCSCISDTPEEEGALFVNCRSFAFTLWTLSTRLGIICIAFPRHNDIGYGSM